LSQFTLYREPVVLDYVLHRHLKLGRHVDHTIASGMHACYLAAAEFAAAAHDYVIVFVRDLVDGKPLLQPIVILGVLAGENLYVGAAPGAPWDARYVPAYIRRYPFWVTNLEGFEAPAMMIDRWWKGFSDTEGDPLYDGDNKPAQRLIEAIAYTEEFQREVERTQDLCKRIDELDLLREMSANVTLPDGKTISLDGFLTIDTDKLQALPDAQVIELHRSGALGLLHAHLTSLGNLQGLTDRKARRMTGTAH